MKYFLHNVDKTYESENILTGPGMVSTTMPASNWDLGPGVMWSPLCCSFIWSKTIKSQASSCWSWSRHHLTIFLHQTFICNILWQFFKLRCWYNQPGSSYPGPLLDQCWVEQIGWGPQFLLVCRHRFLAEKTSSTERKKPEYSDKIILWTYLF